jgi:hypothetical protein
MDVEAIKKHLGAFIRRHRSEFESMTSRETALLEMGALVMSAEHYRLAGYTVSPQNERSGRFVVKLSSRGHPYNFSWFHCVRGADACEIHANLAVHGGHRDGAVYVVDVAVVHPDKTPKKKEKKPWVALSNEHLITFAEVKKLVIYPMLLAQFIGIVHEIKPKALRRAGLSLDAGSHFYPALVSVGYLQGTSRKILEGFKKRKYRISVVDSFDFHISSMSKGGASTSPFAALVSTS